MRRLVLLCLLPVLLSGCIAALVAGTTETGVSLAENRSIGRKVDDTVIYTDLTNTFIQNDAGKLLTYITFNVRYGRVMLTGVVPNEQMAQQATALAWKAKGVLEVINELIVNPNRSYGQIAEDSLTKRNLESRLLFTKEVWVINYSIDVNEGNAFLIGRVHDRPELNRVLNVARTTRGVKRVVSHLQINPDTQNGTGAPAGSPAPTAPNSSMSQPAGEAEVIQKNDPIDSTPIPPVTSGGGY